MCGIAGVLELNREKPVDPGVLTSMCDAIRRRGPDDAGYLVRENMGIGMRRLSIIDVAGSHQPISNEDGTLTIVFNGEIFNYKPLQAGLKARGHRFKTNGDTETILHLFEEEGPNCLRHLRGMFAIAIWNARDRSLFIARDRLGIKPVHYYFDGQRFIFGSEIKAILRHPSVTPTIDWTAADSFFTYAFIPAPWTIYKEIRKLHAGHYMIIDERGMRQHKYWDLSFASKLKGSEADITAEFTDLFRESVEMRMMSEVPLGAFLSGGVDSVLVVATMAQSSNQPVQTFTIGFGGETGNFLDERPFARDVSARYGTEHREFEVQPAVEEALDATLDAFDEPFADDSLIPTYHICQLARRHVTVALTGLGGDEGFAGYERHLGFSLSSIAEQTPWRQMIGLARPFVNALRESNGGHYHINHLKRFVRAHDLPPAKRWQSFQAMADAESRRRLYLPDISREIDFERVDAMGYDYFQATDSDDPLDRVLNHELKFYLADNNLALTDRVGMWHSLELRVPFCDHKLVEFSARVPSSLKLKGREKKHLLRTAARPLLPASVLNHRKQGFTAPMAIWLRGSMRNHVKGFLAPSKIARSGVLMPDEVERQMVAHDARRSLNDKKIFSMLMFERWWRRHQD